MRPTIEENRPIFQQIKEFIEEDIVAGTLKEGEQVPSTNQMVAYYKINPATVLKGYSQLVEEGVLYKKRGVGMFVQEGAQARLLQTRREAFLKEYVEEMVQEAHKLGITKKEIYYMIDSIIEEDQHESNDPG